MPRIFELFGYPLSLQTPAAQQCRQQAFCPFTRRECDGGGNRYSSHIDIPANSPLKQYFAGRNRVAAGICSIQLTEHEPPWIVCPHRILSWEYEASDGHVSKRGVAYQILHLLNYPSGSKLGIWPEVKLQFEEVSTKGVKNFNYMFDYIVMPVADVSQDDMMTQVSGNWQTWRRRFEKGGYIISQRKGIDVIEDAPSGVPGIIEIMTSSTSGGNKSKRTTVAQAFQDAIAGKEHHAPGINKRQIWARMVSQLIVKSEIAIAWGGKAIWVVQDMLASYISSSTALNLADFVAEQTGEVNLLSVTYSDLSMNPTDILQLRPDLLFSGPISSAPDKSLPEPDFRDIIRAPALPSLERLLARLSENKPMYTVIAP